MRREILDFSEMIDEKFEPFELSLSTFLNCVVRFFIL